MKLLMLLLLATSHFDLAKTCVLEQELERAFRHFLHALEEVEMVGPQPMSAAEQVVFDEALELYLEGVGSNAVAWADKMLERFEAQPDWHYLNFLLASAHANREEYVEFFERFYAHFPQLGDSFLADKTRGVLYLRLSKLGRTEEERRRDRDHALFYLNRALGKNGKDAGLYKVLIFHAKEEKNAPLCLRYLQKMVKERAYIARDSILFYVEEALALGEHALAEEVLDVARTQYTFSRALVEAERLVTKG